jgi:hypothetical protein
VTGVPVVLEGPYKTRLAKKIIELLPGAMVLRLDANLLQGIPDMIVLYGTRWGSLEGKASPDAPYRPNQEYYIDLMNRMSFSARIDPSNEEEVLRDLQQALNPRWSSRLSES